MVIHKDLFIGIDGGGTRTRALLVDSNGTILGYGLSGSTNRNHHSRSTIIKSMTSAFLDAANGVDLAHAKIHAFLGMSGVSTETDSLDLISIAQEVFGVDAKIAVENDSVIGLTGAFSGGPGVVLIASTGSVCLGRNDIGSQWMCGGWGALADDVGSAPWIGLRAIQAALWDEDGRGAKTSLKKIVFNFLGLSEPRAFINRIHNVGIEREELGRIAPLVVQASVEGDTIAAEILNDAVIELTRMVKVTAEKVFESSPCRLVLSGGLAKSGHPFEYLLTNRIELEIPNVTVHDSQMLPVQGAVLEALRLGDVVWDDHILENVRNADVEERFVS